MENGILVYMVFILSDILGSQLLKPYFWISNSRQLLKALLLSLCSLLPQCWKFITGKVKM